MLKNRFKFRLLLGLVYLMTISITSAGLIAQNDSLNYEVYQLGFNFQEGVYTSFEEFKINKPSLQQKLDKQGANLLIWDDSTQSMVVVNPKKIWGYSHAGNVYVSYEDNYWRIINIGQLSQFSAVIIKTFNTIDAFGFPVENQTKSMSPLFLDMIDGAVYELTFKNLSHYMESDPLLNKQFKKNKRIKTKELVLALKAYNQLHPLYFPVYE